MGPNNQDHDKDSQPTDLLKPVNNTAPKIHVNTIGEPVENGEP